MGTKTTNIWSVFSWMKAIPHILHGLAGIAPVRQADTNIEKPDRTTSYYQKAAMAAARRWTEKRVATGNPVTATGKAEVAAATEASRKRTPRRGKEDGATAMGRQPRDGNGTDSKTATMEERLKAFLDTRCELRFNVLTEAVEYRERGGGTHWRPITERVLNTLCVEAHRQGVDCWDRDLLRVVNSELVAPYHPFRDYFAHLPAWDGHDRLAALARRVSADPLWVASFHRWMLGMAAQWGGLADGLHAQSVAPVLVSDQQGMGKSSFCRALMPPELRGYYADNVDLRRTEQVERMLVEMGLLNLDEFDRIAPRQHPALKNLMQLSALSMRKAYQKHCAQLPRIAAFIGTSNSRELLTDPSGSRRFICVLVEHPIDSADIDHAQVFAQLKAELARGERHWFDREEEAALQNRNRAFYRVSPVEETVLRSFRAAAPGEPARLAGLVELHAVLRRRYRAAMAAVSLPALAHALAAMGVERVHTKQGNRWKVVEVAEE